MTDQRWRATALIVISVAVIVLMVHRALDPDRGTPVTSPTITTTTVDPALDSQCYQQITLWTFRLIDTNGVAYADAREALGSQSTHLAFAMKIWPTLSAVQAREGQRAMIAQADGAVRAFCDLPPD